MTRTKLTLSRRFILSSLFLGACGLPSEVDAPVEPGTPLEVLAQTARIPQLTKIDPPTVFSGALQILTLTGRNFTPDTRVYIDGTAIPVSRLISTTQLQVVFPSTITTLGKRLFRVENSTTYRGSDRSDLLTVVQDPLLLATLEQQLDGDPGKQIISSDVNGDSRADMVMLSPDTSTVRVYLSQGRGKPISQSFRVGGGAVAVAAGDVTGDGKIDLVVLTPSSANTYAGDGAGGFAYTGGSTDARYGTVDSLPGILTLADVSGDGRLDVCFGTRQGVLAYSAGKGDGTFAPSVMVRSTGAEPILQVRADDVTGDAKPDLMAVTGGELPLLGKTGSVFVVPMGVGTGTPAASFVWSTLERVTAVASGDYNRDGKTDVAAVSMDGKLNVFYGTGDGKFPTGRSMPISSPGSQLFSVDWNRDGKIDLMMGGRADTSTVLYGGIFFQGGGDGTFAGAAPLRPIRLSFANIAIADVDGDMKPDLVGLDDKSGKAQLYWGRADATLLSSPDSGLLLRDYVATGDFNGDGVLDMASASVVANMATLALGIGDGQFKSVVGYANLDKGPSALAAGDFNNDGKLDLVAPNLDSSVVSLLLGNGDGTLAVQRTFSVGKAPTGIAVADLNADGFLDLVTSNSEADNASVLLGNGTGNFATAKEYGVGKYPVAVVVGDFSGDGRPDLVTANADSANVSYLQQSAVSAGNFNLAKSIAACASPASLSAVDLNGDGKLDLLVACSDDAGIAYLIGKGDGTFNAAKAMPTCDFPAEVQAAQLSDDSKPDLVVACGSPKRLQFYVQVGALAFAQSPRTADLGRGFFVGDVNRV